MSQFTASIESPRTGLMEGLYNFRELGGYKTIDGKRIRNGVLFRSDRLQPATDADLEWLDSLGIRLLFDFRTEEVRKKHPNRLPERTSIETRNRPISSAEIGKPELVDGLQSGSVGLDEAVQYMKNSYINVVKNYQEVLRELLQEASQSKSTPILFHCSAGKDRTGIAAAMLLFSLGVSRKTVFHDYLLTNDLKMDYFSETVQKFKTQAPHGSEEALQAMLRVDSSYLEAALDYIEEEYQSIDNYLTTSLGLNEQLRHKLRSNLLE
ncbi:tyrosine-protein phosphatase [Endozoicomonas arenosclerae]|uniref:tyrosine-protein phosphatase n=1 Tax=Endozoicomonas arenosclerae TaxID=1633495 RepID=UPI000B0C4B80|nr:tyrosine-protein phosphatase [Endozoicomonas arenosclerae]